MTMENGDEVKKFLSKIGKKGGKNRWKNVSPEDRKRLMTEAGKKGNAKRWGVDKSLDR